MSELAIALATISDRLPSCSLFDVRRNLPNPEYSFLDKIIALSRTPFEKTLFLDTDTFVIEPLDEIFELLERFDMAAARAGTIPLSNSWRVCCFSRTKHRRSPL